MIVDFSKIDAQLIEGFKGGSGELVMRSFDDGNCKIMLSTLRAGARAGKHVHDDSCEVILVLEGELTFFEDGIEETLTYCDFPSEHWTRIRTNNAIERLNREIRRRTRVVGCFPDGNSALMLVCARLRHVAGTQWGNKKYMNMKHLEALQGDASLVG